MKCELCHKSDAETVLRKQVGDEVHEWFVCQACAQAAAKPPAPDRNTRQTGEGGMPEASVLPLFGMIVDAAFEIADKQAMLTEPGCPVCGIRRSEYRKRSRLGCPACYEAFADELDAALQELHRATRHTGRAPRNAEAACCRQELERALDEAVREQRYEEAIALRDRLRALDGGQDAAPGGVS